MLKVPAAVGVPVMLPSALSVSPFGSVPTTENVYGPVPPVTVRAAPLNGTPTSPLVPLARHVRLGPPMMVKPQGRVAVAPVLSVTCSEKVPATVGIPVTIPVVGSRLRPRGSVLPLARENVNGATPPLTSDNRLEVVSITPTSPVTGAHCPVVTPSGW